MFYRTDVYSAGKQAGVEANPNLMIDGNKATCNLLPDSKSKNTHNASDWQRFLLAVTV